MIRQVRIDLCKAAASSSEEQLEREACNLKQRLVLKFDAIMCG